MIGVVLQYMLCKLLTALYTYNYLLLNAPSNKQQIILYETVSLPTYIVYIVDRTI